MNIPQEPKRKYNFLVEFPDNIGIYCHAVINITT